MKKTFSVSLALALTMVLLLAACGDSRTNVETGAPTVSAADEDKTADKPDDTVPAAPGTPGEAPDAPKDAVNEPPAPTDAPPEKPSDSGQLKPEAKPEPPTPDAAPETSDAPPAGPAEAEETGVSLAAVRDRMLSDLGISSADYVEVSAAQLLNLYGIQEADLAQSASFATMSGVFPWEVVLVEAVDDAAAARIAALLQTRLNEVLNQYKTYDAETYALAEACTIDTDGRVVSMLLSPQRSEMRKILADSLG